MKVETMRTALQYAETSIIIECNNVQYGLVTISRHLGNVIFVLEHYTENKNNDYLMRTSDIVEVLQDTPGDFPVYVGIPDDDDMSLELKPVLVLVAGPDKMTLVLE